MSDRIKGFTIILDADYKDEDAQEMAHIFHNIRFVKRVIPHTVTSMDYIDRERIKAELIDKILKVLE